MKALIGTDTSINIRSVKENTDDLAKLLAVSSKKWMCKYLKKKKL